MIEEWKDIKFKDFDGTEYDYTGLYKISNNGDVYSYKTKKILSKNLDKDGYCRSVLSKKGKVKTFKNHRLVAFMFIDILDKNKTYVNHKDEKKDNNNVDNLEWCTVSENNNHGSRQKRVHEKRKELMKTEKWKKEHSGLNNPTSKQIVLVNINDMSVEKFETATKASVYLNVGVSAISTSLKRKSITNGFLVFEEKEYNDISLNKEELFKLISYKKEKYLQYYRNKK